MVNNLRKYATADPGDRSNATCIKQLNQPQHHQSLFELNPDAIFSLDREGFFTSANQSFLELAEIAMEDLLEMNFRQFCSIEDLERVEAHFERTINGSFQRFKLNVLTTRANPLYLESSSIPRLIEGEITGAYYIVKKINQPENAIAEIKRITTDLNKIITASVDIICSIDPDGKFIQVSSTSKAIWGYHPDELIGRPYIGLIVEEDRESTLLMAAELMSGRVVTNFENRYICKDGSVKTMLWSARWNPEEKTMYCMAQNISVQKEAERKYQNLFNINPQAMWIFDAVSLQFLDINEAAIRHYGYSREEFLSMTINEIRPVEDVKLLGEILKRCNANNGFHHCVVRHLKKCGERIDVQVESSPIEYKGRDARLVLVIDITAKLKAEYSVQLSEQRFKSLVQNGTDMIGILDAEGVYKYVSPTSTDILGIPPEDFIGKNAFDFIHPDDLERIYNEFSMLQQSKRIQLQPFRFLNAKGQYRWIETNITNLLDNHSVQGIVSNSRDVTERMENLEAIRKSEEKTSLIMNAALDAVICINREGRITFWNPQAEKIFGWKEEEVTGKMLASVIAPEGYVLSSEDGIRNILRTGELPILNYLWEQCAIDKNGMELPIELIVVPIQQQDEEFFCVYIRDITDRKSYLRYIEDQNQRLREIAWTQSHIVRAPLARILGLADLIKNNNDHIDRSELMDYLYQSALDLDAIIKEIVDKTQKINLE